MSAVHSSIPFKSDKQYANTWHKTQEEIVSNSSIHIFNIEHRMPMTI